MFLKFKPFVGPAEYTFKDPDTGYLFKETSRKSLFSRIVAYRAQNNLPPIEELALVVESYLCSLPVHQGLCTPVGPLKRGLLSYFKGGVALATNLWYNKVVSKEEADRRGAICVKCPLNVFPDKGPFVAWSDSIAEASVGSLRSKYHEELGNCEGCSCPLRAKVFYGGTIKLTVSEATTMKNSNPKCWQLEGKIK